MPLTNHPPEQFFARFDDDPAVIYAIDSGFRLLYHNSAWDRFAIENGGPGLAGDAQIGSQTMDVVPLPLQRFYREGFARAFREPHPWEHVYECSSPDRRRMFHMQVLPVDRSALLIVNAKVTEVEIPEQQHRVLKEYLEPAGMVTMCCHCRKTLRRIGKTAGWDWVPEFVAHPPVECSHGLCPTCLAYHYPVLGEEGLRS